MKRTYLFIIILAGICTIFACNKQHSYNALIITGQNNHNWNASSKVLKQLLDQTGLFSSSIAKTPPQGQEMSSFNPDFTKYDVVILDYNGDSWSDKTKTAFTDYVKNGGGVVIYHAADNSFPEWKEFNEMIGLGGWGSRTEKDGPYVYYKNDSLVTDTAPGNAGSHGERHAFLVRIRNSEHPITLGLPEKWMHAEDELYSQLRGPAKNMEILATAYADTSKHGTGRDEPALFTINYGKGRIFHTTLGHSGNDEKSFPALECAGFIITFQRGAEWAASGAVTQAVPVDFPNSASVVRYPDYKALTLDEIMKKIGQYEVGKNRFYFADLQNYIRKSDGKAETLLMYEKKMVKLLQNKHTSIDSKKLIIKELSWMGSKYSIGVLKELEKSDDLKDEVRFTLSRLNTEK
jgi:type 1 glutamine amidotransferase